MKKNHMRMLGIVNKLNKKEREMKEELTIMELVAKIAERSGKLSNELSLMDKETSKFYHRIENGEMDEMKAVDLRKEISDIKKKLLKRRDVKQELHCLNFCDKKGNIDNFGGYVKVLNSVVNREVK